MAIDIHTHILPSIDDGAKDMPMSLEMLNIAIKDGITDIILTPHLIPGSYDNSSAVVMEHMEKLKEAVKELGMEINIYPGNEVFISPDVPKLLEDGTICSLNNSRYVLIELPLTIVPQYTEDVLYEVRLKGYTPIIAHPERNAMIGKNPTILENLVQQGSLAQVNATSINGLYGKDIQKSAMKLINKNLIHFVSSDSHTCRGRAPKLSEARKLVADKFGEKKAELLFEANGKNVVNNFEIISEYESVPVEKNKSWGIMLKQLIFQALK